MFEDAAYKQRNLKDFGDAMRSYCFLACDITVPYPDPFEGITVAAAPLLTVGSTVNSQQQNTRLSSNQVRTTPPDNFEQLTGGVVLACGCDNSKHNPRQL